MSRYNIMAIKNLITTPPPSTSLTRGFAHNSPNSAAAESQKRPAPATTEDPDVDQENLGRGRRKRVKTAKAIESDSRRSGALTEAANTLNIGTRTANPGDEHRTSLNTSTLTKNSNAPNTRPRTASPAPEQSSSSTNPPDIELGVINRLKGELVKVLKKTSPKLADEATGTPETEAVNAIPAENSLVKRTTRSGDTRATYKPPQVTTRSVRETRPREHRNSTLPDKIEQKFCGDADLDRANKITESGPYDKSGGNSRPKKIDAQKEPLRHLERYLRDMALPEENLLGRREFLSGKIQKELEWVFNPTFSGRGQNGAKMFVGHFWQEFDHERPWAKEWEQFKRERIHAATGDAKRQMIAAYWAEPREAAQPEDSAAEEARMVVRFQLMAPVHRLPTDTVEDLAAYRAAITLMRMQGDDDDEAEEAATILAMSGALPDDEPNGPNDEPSTSSDREL